MVRAKKYLGQHFLKDKNIAEKIVNSLFPRDFEVVIEIGAGMGILTQFLVQNTNYETYIIEIDIDSVEYLKQNMNLPENRIFQQDFLKFDLKNFSDKPIAIIGNFPYNISSQILFKVLENRNIVIELVGMFQKETAKRISEKPGNKTYGILSVLTQAFYNVEYLFTVNENVFVPPPKVKSGVLRMRRKQNYDLNCDEKKFFRIVKQSFNQRRKTLRNSLKSILSNIDTNLPVFSKRPEQLSVEEFVELTNMIDV
jgi:16S rRNA (adenine1518-N6/adenine1519-N6)-dimethyltransferase